MNNRFPIFFVLLMLLLSACSQTPSWVIPEKKMEDLLYDIHLAESEVDNNYATFDDSLRKSKLFDAVFEKHRMTKAEFDTSLNWYASHLNLYVDIYDRVVQRYSILNDTLMAQMRVLDSLENRPKLLWADNIPKLLKPFGPENKYTFHLDTSSYFAPGDMYELNVFVLGVNKCFRPKVTFVWEGRDTSVVRRKEIVSDGSFVMYIPAVPGMKTESLYGSIRVPLDRLGARLLINRLTLYKHKQGHHPDIKEQDTSLSPDTLKTDSVPKIFEAPFSSKDVRMLKNLH